MFPLVVDFVIVVRGVFGVDDSCILRVEGLLLELILHIFIDLYN